MSEEAAVLVSQMARPLNFNRLVKLFQMISLEIGVVNSKVGGLEIVVVGEVGVVVDVGVVVLVFLVIHGITAQARSAPSRLK